MKNHSWLIATVLTTLCLAVLPACSPAPNPGGAPPAGFERDERAPQLPYLVEVQPVVVDVRELPPGPAEGAPGRRDVGRRLESPLTEDEIERLQEAALHLPPQPMIQMLKGGPSFAPTLAVAFESLDYVTAGGNFVPPDPELAVGPNHVIAVVNDYIEIYDRFGTPLAPPIWFGTFFFGVTGCGGLFDPNVLYDEQLDRFVIGADANGTNYCVGMTQSSDPTTAWTLYAIGTVPPSPTPDFFDYPHAGVGQDAIYMGANVYDSTATFYLRSEVWAFDKYDMAASLPLTPLMQPVTGSFTPQPMNAHGWAQGTWPVNDPHFFIANQIVPGYSGDLFDVWAWSDPFGANTFGLLGTVNLAAATFPAGYPIDAPQNGGLNVQANDWRVLDAEYRNGDLWMTHTISCNSGTVVDCVRWAEIDFAPAPSYTPTILQAGVFATPDEYRIFPDLAVNHCDDMTIGYTKTSLQMWPAVWVTGRWSTDPPNLLQPEAQLRQGDTPYVSWDGPPHRWGDYTGGTSDPDGVGTWYLGEYAKLILPPPFANWGTVVGGFFTPCGVNLGVTKTDGVTQVAPGASVTYTITVTNFGSGDAIGATVTDTFPVDLTGVTWTCTGQAGPPTSTCSAGSGSGNINITADLQAGSSITITANGTLSTSASGSLVNTATASPVGIIDPIPGDNSATDVDTILPAADLGVTKVDGQASAVPGESVTYTVVATNAGPLNVIGATVTDTLPGILNNVAWTCSDQIGPPASICTNASGAGNISELVDIEVGAAVIFTITGDIDPGAIGTLSNTASVAPPAGILDPISGNNSATDADPLTPEADLDVGVTDGSCYVLPGGSVTYTVTVDNLGPSHAPSASVSDTVPADLTVTSWTCAASGSAVCGSASGSGPLSDTPNLTAGGGVTYTVSGTVAGSASGWLIYTVTAAPGAGLTDPDSGNDTDNDRNALETPIFCDGFEGGTTGVWSNTHP